MNDEEIHLYRVKLYRSWVPMEDADFELDPLVILKEFRAAVLREASQIARSEVPGKDYAEFNAGFNAGREQIADLLMSVAREAT